MPWFSASKSSSLLCFSHLRWNFVFQRPQHLLRRAATDRRVFYVEEPLYAALSGPQWQQEQVDGITIAVPQLPKDCDEVEAIHLQRVLIDDLLAREQIQPYVLWYFTPMALAFTDHLKPEAIAYDCMDELSAFAHAPVAMRFRERQLLRRADVVFTGGQSLYEVKRGTHPNVHALPSSVDIEHFARARHAGRDPIDQAIIERPRLGFFGVIDERMDLDLLAGVATARPDWQLVMLGPVVKIDQAVLPRPGNIHYLGAKPYADLPEYIRGWDVALLPFARSEATRYLSPTKTPEYLAAGKPVVSTSICDVVRPYGEQKLVRIADTVPAFIAACERALVEDPRTRLGRVDRFLSTTSWDSTWMRMRELIDEAVSMPRPAGSAGRHSSTREGSCSTT